MSKRMGRPPEGLGSKGEPEKISDYPKLTITIRPATKSTLDALSLMEQRPVWKVIDSAVIEYVGSLSQDKRKTVLAVKRHATEQLNDKR